MTSLKEHQATILFNEIQSIREKINLRYTFNNAVLPLSMAGFGATLALSKQPPLDWLIFLIPPCALILASYSILQAAYIIWLAAYIRAKSKVLNQILEEAVVDYELNHAHSKDFNRYCGVSIGIIWGIWLVVYLAFLVYAALEIKAIPLRVAYSVTNVMFFLLHLVSCYFIAFSLPKKAKRQFML